MCTPSNASGPWRRCQSPDLGAKFAAAIDLYPYFLKYQKQCRIGWRKLPCQNQLGSYGLVDRTPNCGRQTQGHSYSSALASCRAAKIHLSKQTSRQWSSIKYQLSLIDPRDKTVLSTELDDLCDRPKLQWSSVGARMHCQLSWPTVVQFIISTFLELSW